LATKLPVPVREYDEFREAEQRTYRVFVFPKQRRPERKVGGRGATLKASRTRS
jgi:hypothetical protein